MNGLEVVDGVQTSQTCFDACGGDPNALCCKGIAVDNSIVDACSGFTGKVCRDGSCSDEVAFPGPSSYSGTCQNANVGEISGPSCIGQQGK